MKAEIHPNYMECKVTCGCGNTFTTGGTVPEIRIEICSACHPFYTGKQKFVDSAGRVDRLGKKRGEQERGGGGENVRRTRGEEQGGREGAGGRGRK